MISYPKVGQRCYKWQGYWFVGEIRAVFTTAEGLDRIVVQMDRGPNGGGFLHIFDPSQFRDLQSEGCGLKDTAEEVVDPPGCARFPTRLTLEQEAMPQPELEVKRDDDGSGSDADHGNRLQVRAGRAAPSPDRETPVGSIPAGRRDKKPKKRTETKYDRLFRNNGSE